MPKTVLVVEDEPTLRETLAEALESEGYRAIQAGDGRSGLALFHSERPDLVLLDLMLPELSGLEVTRQVRAESTVPIVMLTARDAEVDKVVGLELGADDYVTKPFSPRELVARIRAVVRRGAPADRTAKTAQLRAGDLAIDRERFEVRMKDTLVTLTPKEFDLLATLVGAPGRVFKREELLDIVWGRDGFVEPRTVDVHMARLRSKFVAAKLEGPGIETVRGVGYRCRDGQS